MKRAQHSADHNNIAFVEHIDRLSELGVTQKELADRLGISAGQISRVKKGERPAIEKHVIAMRDYIAEIRKARKGRATLLASQQPAQSVFSIDRGVLLRLSPTAAVEAFRGLLFARAAARGIPTTAVNISSNVCTADGGVDASVSDDAEPIPAGDELLDARTRFQIKTGDFAPWRLSRLKSELFGRKQPRFENLGSGIQETLLGGGRIVFVCFGVDPVDRELREARRHLKDLFATCGYSDARFDVWGQSDLIGLYNQYPSLCLGLRGYDHDGFRSHESWLNDDDMRQPLSPSPERSQIMRELRQLLISNEIGHVRLLGEPGVGKTRLALEITRDCRLAPLTLYVREGRALLRSPFINELINADDHRFVVFVVDECSNKDRAELWNRLKAKSDRIRVISIDHGPDDSFDDRTRSVSVAPLGDADIVAILMDHGIDRDEARRWSAFCQGCPRVAHVLGDNLRRGRANLLQTPATVEVWNRFVVGNDLEDSEEVQLRRVVLRHLALFERFGFEAPVGNEARFIADLAATCDPRLTWRRFQSIVRDLQKRRILQGVTTLYLTPRLLQIHLFREFWEQYGADFDIANSLTNMPPALWNWFVQMLRYAHDSPTAERAIENVLESPEIFPTGNFPNRGEIGRVVAVLSETCPKAGLRCLQRTIGEMNVDALRRLDEPRQFLVWALEKIGVWRECFVGAARLLLMLAEAENSNHGNNATGTFEQLFSLNRGFAPTQAEPAIRLAVLDDVLESKSTERRKLGLRACAKALNTSADFRLVGPEHQGLRKKLEFWTPNTYDEFCECHRQVWELLVSKRGLWEGDDRSRLHSTLISAAWSTLHIRPLTTLVLDTLKSIANDPATDTGALVTLIKRQLGHKNGNLPADVREGLASLCQSLDGHDFSSRLRRFVKFLTWDDAHGDDGHDGNRINLMLDTLADQAAGDVALLRSQLPWLVQEASNAAYCFAFRLSQRDLTQRLLDPILSHYAAGSKCETTLLAGYLAGIFARDVRKWETLLEQMADNPSLGECFSDIVIASGISDSMAKMVIVHCRSGKQSIERLERWWFARQLTTLSQETIADLISLHLENPTGRSWSNAVHIYHSFFIEGDKAKILPEEMTFTLLLHSAMGQGFSAHEAGYYWSRIASAFLVQYPARKWDFFRELIRVGAREWRTLSDLNTQGESLVTDLLRQDPERAFSCISEAFEDEQELRSYALSHWLSQGGHRIIGDETPGPIQYIPARTLFSWVDRDVQRHGSWLAQVLPKTLDDSVAGRLTRDFISRYANDRAVCASLNAHMHSRGWCGKASDHYRRLRNEAREWLVDESDLTVIRWIGEYIEGLTYSLDRAQIDEEREPSRSD